MDIEGRVPAGGRTPRATAALWRSRGGVCLLFLIYGAVIGSWTARIPAVKQGLGLGDGQLSIGLLAFAAGAITGMQGSGRLVDRYGSARIMVPVALVDGALLVPPAYAPNLVALAACLYLLGAVHGMLNVSMNAHAVEVERAWRRPIMSSFHAVYSMGGVAGAAVGGLFAHAAIGPGATFVAVAAGMTLMAIGAARLTRVRGTVPDAATASTPPVGRVTVRERSRLSGVLLLGALAFCCLVGEGAAADWSTVYLRDDLHSSSGFAAAAYAGFSIMMMVGRLVGDRLAALLGPVRLVRGCGLLAAAGLGAALLVGHPVAGVIGFGCLGAGLSCVAPQIFSAAGNQEPARAGRALARVASIGWLGFFFGPVLIGGAAELAGLPRALAVPAALALVIALGAAALRPRRAAANLAVNA